MKRIRNAPLAAVPARHTDLSYSPSSSSLSQAGPSPASVGGQLRLAATSERRTAASVHPLTVVRPDVAMFVTHIVQRLMRLTRVSNTETEVQLSAHERRVVRAIDEAQDVRDAASQLDAHMASAMADGEVTLDEAWQAYRLAQRVLREARESVVAAQWTDAGERKAAAALLDTLSVPRIERYEREILQQADELGMVLAGMDSGRVLTFPAAEPLDAA